MSARRRRCGCCCGSGVARQLLSGPHESLHLKGFAGEFRRGGHLRLFDPSSRGSRDGDATSLVANAPRPTPSKKPRRPHRTVSTADVPGRHRGPQTPSRRGWWPSLSSTSSGLALNDGPPRHDTGVTTSRASRRFSSGCPWYVGGRRAHVVRDTFALLSSPTTPRRPSGEVVEQASHRPAGLVLPDGRGRAFRAGYVVNAVGFRSSRADWPARVADLRCRAPVGRGRRCLVE